MTSEYVDVIIVGAGLSGIGAACQLQEQCPAKSYAILEGREALGGTWDLFRYPGIRSDSDMHTLGYRFKPWLDSKAIADGPAILDYIKETAVENGVEEHIRYGHRVRRATWSSKEAAWTIEVRRGETGRGALLRSNFLLMCAGYYSYDGGYTPDFKGRERFQGEIVHPQAWPEDLDYRGKDIVVIGSGATAVTLVPELAKEARHVVMLQRSPTYMIARPDRDKIADSLRRFLPQKAAYAMTRWKNITMQQWLYRQTRSNPEKIRGRLIGWARKALPTGYDVKTHFTPRYNPWDQRLCLVPNGDLFAAISSGKASVVTDVIDGFTDNGVLLKSGEEVKADIIVTATGLQLVMIGDIALDVDGDPVDFSERFAYKGVMLSDVPNLISTFGYVNASWTLRADLVAAFACRLFNYMDERGARQCTPRLREADYDMPERPWVADFSSGYMQRVLDKLPKQGDREPWLNPQDYRADKRRFLKESLDDGVLDFADRAQPVEIQEPGRTVRTM